MLKRSAKYEKSPQPDKRQRLFLFPPATAWREPHIVCLLSEKKPASWYVPPKKSHAENADSADNADAEDHESGTSRVNSAEEAAERVEDAAS